MFFASKKENEYLKGELAHAHEEIDSLETTLREAGKYTADLFGRLKESDAALEAEKAKTAELRKELEDERYRHDRVQDFEVAEAEELRKTKEALEASRAHALEEFNARSELQAVVDELRHDLKKAREREADLVIRLQSACEAMTANENRAMELQTEANELRKQLAELEAVANEYQRIGDAKVAELEAALLSAMETSAKLERDLLEKQEEVNGTRIAYEGAVKDREDLEARNVEYIRELQAENLKLKADNNHKQTIIQAYESTTASARNQHEERIKELDATLGKVQDERDRAEDNVRVLETRLKEVAAERDEAKEAVEDMKARFADRREKHTLEVNALVSERNQLKQALEGALSDVATWKRRFEDASHLTEGWHQEACDLRGELTDAKKDLEVARAKCEALAEKLMAVEAERDLLKGDLEAVMAERKNCEANPAQEACQPMKFIQVEEGLFWKLMQQALTG